MITPEEIEKLAGLARISLSTEEKEQMRGEFDSILEYVATLAKVTGAGGEEPALSAVSQVNVLREDGVPHESARYTEALLSSAPSREGDYVKVKKIL